MSSDAPKKPFPWWIIALVAGVLVLGGGLVALFSGKKALGLNSPCDPAASKCPAPLTCVPDRSICLVDEAGACSRVEDCAAGRCEEGKCTCNGATDSIEAVNQALSQAIATIGEQPSSWQGTLTDLESNIARQVSNLEQHTALHTNQLASRVDEQRQKAIRGVLDLETQLVSDLREMVHREIRTAIGDGIQFGRQSNCTQDPFSAHARIAVKNILSTFLNKQKYQGTSERSLEQYTPVVCSANPTSIDVAKWDPSTSLILSGADLDLFETQKPSLHVWRVRAGLLPGLLVFGGDDLQ